MAYLDENGLSLLWTKIKGLFKEATTSAAGLMSAADKVKLDNTNVGYGTCATAAATAAKTVTLASASTWKMQAGSVVYVWCTYSNTANNPTLNVNGTGAKPIYYNGSQITTSNKTYATYANRLMKFVFTGTYYLFAGWGIDNNSTYANYSFGNGYATCATAATTVAKTATYTYYSLKTGGIVSVKFTYAVTSLNSTLNINSQGAKPMYFNGAKLPASMISAGDIATFIYDGTNYNLISIDSAFRTATTSKKGLMSAEDKDKLSHLDAPYPNGEYGNSYSIIMDFNNGNGQYIVNLDEWADMGYLYNRGLYLLEANEYSDIDGDAHCAILFVYKPLDDGGSLIFSQKNTGFMSLSLANNNLQFNNSDGSGDFTLRELNSTLRYL